MILYLDLMCHTPPHLKGLSTLRIKMSSVQLLLTYHISTGHEVSADLCLSSTHVQSASIPRCDVASPHILQPPHTADVACRQSKEPCCQHILHPFPSEDETEPPDD